jgi:para-nitrobenzyl esterase
MYWHGRAASGGSLDVRVSGGIVRGIAEGGTRAWRGIPYAAPPVGTLRFQSPRAVATWQGVHDASRYGKVAPQAYRGQFKGVGPGIPSGEDCLTLNVLSGATTGAELRNLPVMVFIHGGGYSAGSSQDFFELGAGFVRSEGIVYVSFNYRLGALGYLDFTRYATLRHPIDSNLGLRDQVAALRWVRRNIRAFGGNPHNVTVFGESAGGNAVTTLMATPSARGLFSGAIAQSAPANAAYSRELAGRWAGEFVAILRNGQQDGTDAAELLKNTEATELVTAALTLQVRTPDDYPGTFCLAPVVDGLFLPERPLDAFRGGRAHRVPLIIGTNDREGSIFRRHIDILPRSAGRIRSVFQLAPEDSRAPMRSAYPGLPMRRAAANFGGDFAFWYPSIKVAELHSHFAPVYAYRFNLAPRLMRVVGLDATHGIELLALFDRTDTPIVRTMTVLGGRELFAEAGKRMRDHWTRFAMTGRVAEGWPIYTTHDRLTFVIDETDRIESDPHGDRRLAWENFLPGL